VRSRADVASSSRRIGALPQIARAIPTQQNDAESEKLPALFSEEIPKRTWEIENGKVFATSGG
jgi:hypothetical protein